MGRPPKSTEDHLRDGTLRTYRHADREPMRLADPVDVTDDAVLAALDDLAADMPPWLRPPDAIALSLLRDRLTMRADLRVQADAGDATARRDLLALDRLIDSSLDSLGLTTLSRSKLDLAEPATGSALAALQAKVADRHRRLGV